MSDKLLDSDSQLAGAYAVGSLAKAKPLALFVFLPFWLYLAFVCDWSDVDPLLQPSVKLLFSKLNITLTTIMLIIVSILPPGWPSLKQSVATVLSFLTFVFVTELTTTLLHWSVKVPALLALPLGAIVGFLSAVGVLALIERLWPDSGGPDTTEP